MISALNNSTLWMIVFALIFTVIGIYYTGSFLLGILPTMALLMYFSMEGAIHTWIYPLIILIAVFIFVYAVVIPVFTEGGSNG